MLWFLGTGPCSAKEIGREARGYVEKRYMVVSQNKGTPI